MENVHDARPTGATSVAGVIGGYAAAAFFGHHAYEGGVAYHIDDLLLIVDMGIGGHRQIGQQQARQVAVGVALFKEQPAFGAGALLALHMKIQPGLQVDL